MIKKIVFAVVVAVGITASAQETEEKREKVKLTSEQRADLQVKQMKLDLDLTDKQSEEIKKLLVADNLKRESKRAEMQAKRAKGEKLTADELYNRKSQMLDEQMKHKEAMKKILTKEQFEKWEKRAAYKKSKMKETLQERKGDKKLELKE